MMARACRYCVPLAALVSLAVSLIAVRLYASFEPRSAPMDYRNRYRPQAEAILHGGGLLLHGEPRTPPGYPLALAGAIALSRPAGIDPDVAALLLNIALMALTAALLTTAGVGRQDCAVFGVGLRDISLRGLPGHGAWPGAAVSVLAGRHRLADDSYH